MGLVYEGSVNETGYRGELTMYPTELVSGCNVDDYRYNMRCFADPSIEFAACSLKWEYLFPRGYNASLDCDDTDALQCDFNIDVGDYIINNCSNNQGLFAEGSPPQMYACI